MTLKINCLKEVQQRTTIGFKARNLHHPRIFLKNCTFLDCADFLNILLELHVNLTDHTTILLTHFSCQERTFRSQCLTRGWYRMASRELGLSCLFAACI